MNALVVLCLAMAVMEPVVPAAGERTDGARSIDFDTEIIPVLTKAGCNTGVCHAKAGGGQNGFELSLLGFEPQDDYDRLVLEGRGRRVFPGAPEESLILLAYFTVLRTLSFLTTIFAVAVLCEMYRRTRPAPYVEKGPGPIGQTPA